jgi:hypothetical protein
MARQQRMMILDEDSAPAVYLVGAALLFGVVTILNKRSKNLGYKVGAVVLGGVLINRFVVNKENI